ncbi:gp436 family protein [Benzoatithermus flavus]|uniref:Phage protein Gp36 family protein n=1 Tax=Benzoatithermus flavus TaxID=3108223 RepID=A0ABU8XNU7_9PROT
MSYASQADLERRYGVAQLLQIADRDDDQAIDAAVVAQALDDADAIVNAYLAGRYELPLPTTPPLLLALACDIAFYKLHPGAQPEDVRRRYEDALATLKDLAAGKAELDLAGGAPAAAPAGEAAFAGPERVFSRASLRGL